MGSNMQLIIDKKWRWLAMDKSGKWFFFNEKPKIRLASSIWLSIWDSCDEGTMVDRTILNSFPDFPWKESLHQRIDDDGDNSYWEKVVTLPDLKVDDPVWVFCKGTWLSRHFKCWDMNSHMVAFSGGMTSHTTSAYASWKRWSVEKPE